MVTAEVTERQARRRRDNAALPAPERQRRGGVLIVPIVLVGLSLKQLASGVEIVIGSSQQASRSMAVGIDLGLVACELAVLVSPGRIRPDVARYPTPAIVGTSGISAAMNSLAFALCAGGWMIYPAIGLGIAVPALIYALIKVAGILALAAERG